jgi:hypothetical protein
MRNLAREEVVGVLLWSALMVVLAGLPYVIANAWAGPQRLFCGFLWGPDEGNAYLAWIRQAAEGKLLLANQYTIRYQNPHFFNLFFVLLGQACRHFHGRPIEAYHLARLLGIPVALYAFYCLAAHLTAMRAVRGAALAIASLGSGLGWYWTLLAYAGRPGRLFPMDCAAGWQAMPEAVTFPTLLLNPLFTWSLALLCLSLLWGWRALENQRLGQALLAGFWLLVLGNVHTYDLFPACGALLVWAGFLVVSGRAPLGATAGLYLLMCLLALPAPLWAWWTAHVDPSYWAKISTPTLSPRLRDYAAGYGLIGAAAVLGAYAAWVLRRYYPRSLAAVGWAAVGLVMVYMPVSFQRKMIEGEHLALSYLAGLAVALVWPWLWERRWGRNLSANQRYRRRAGLVRVGVLAFTLLSLPSNIVFVHDALQHVAVNNADLRSVLMPPVYLSYDEVRGLEWLAEHTSEEDVVLCSSLTGSHIPAWAPARVVAGHWAETLDFPAYVQMVAIFFAPGLLPRLRAQILHATGATYVWWGQYERFLQRAAAEQAVGEPVVVPAAPDRDLPLLKPAFHSGDVTIYRVVG